MAADASLLRLLMRTSFTAAPPPSFTADATIARRRRSPLGTGFDATGLLLRGPFRRDTLFGTDDAATTSEYDMQELIAAAKAELAKR